jgi:uncharacterized protein involved in exopolysaccharide biosynthesis
VDLAAQALNLNHIWAALRRRSTLVLVVAAIATAVTGAVVARLPDVYTAKTVVYLDPGATPRGYDKTAPKLNELLATLTQDVLSRESLRRMIQELNLYELPAPAPVGVQVGGGEGPSGWNERLLYSPLIEKAKNDISVEIVKVYGKDLVEISVRARTADLAARAVNRIAERLVGKNHELRVARAREYNEFMEEELERTQQAMNIETDRLAKFKESRAATLPDQEPRLYAELTGVQRQLSEDKAFIADANAKAESIKVAVNTLFTGGRPGAIPTSTTPGTPGRAPQSAERSNLLRELSRLEQQEAELRAKYVSPEFPDRQANAGALEAVKARLKALDGLEQAQLEEFMKQSTPSTTVKASLGAASEPVNAAGSLERAVENFALRGGDPSTVAEARRLVGELTLLARQVTDRGATYEAALKEEARLQGLLASIPGTRSELEKLDASVVSATKSHADRLKDAWESRKFLNGEKALVGSTLRTAELAEAPLLPAAPNRLLLVGAALLAGLGLGGGIAFLLEKNNEAYHDRNELEGDLGVKVISVLPAVPHPEHVAKADVFVVVDEEKN